MTIEKTDVYLSFPEEVFDEAISINIKIYIEHNAVLHFQNISHSVKRHVGEHGMSGA